MKRLVGTENAESFLEKVASSTEQLRPQGARNLALTIAMVGGAFRAFPSLRGRFALAGPFSRAARLVVHLIGLVQPDEERASLAGQLLGGVAVPIRFAVEILRWLPFDDDPDAEDSPTTLDQCPAAKPFTAGQRSELAAVLVGRVRALSVGDDPPLVQLGPDELASLLGAWAHYGSREETDAFVCGQLGRDPSFALRVIEGVLPTAHAIESGQSYKKNFEAREYESLGRCVDPGAIAEALVALFGPLSEGRPYSRSAEGTMETPRRSPPVY